MLDFSKSIDEASLVIGKTWPLYNFVTSNPLSGYEKMNFEKAIKQASQNLGSITLPTGLVFRQAWEHNEINSDILCGLLSAASFNEHPEYYLAKMEAENSNYFKNPNNILDTIIVKWLSVFLDEGMGEWEMPNKKDGFYAAWRKLAKYDQKIGIKSIKQIPETAKEAINSVVNSYNTQQQIAIFKYHIAALPGYTGYIKYRMAENSAWQAKYPITLEDYLAVRLWIAKHINAKILLEDISEKETNNHELKLIWLKAWEKSYQLKLIEKIHLTKSDFLEMNSIEKIPEAQMVFCIDTRSELIRKCIEERGNYETFGYAGFFGLAADYQDVNTSLIRKSCPPIVNSAYKISECAKVDKEIDFSNFKRNFKDDNFIDFLTTRMKNMLPSAFGYVEGTGIFYGLKLIAKTLFPSKEFKIKFLATTNHEEICEPEIHLITAQHDDLMEISLNEKVAILKSAFDLLGWKTFAPIVLFVGHGSHSANNAFASSLDCGACAASPGRHNARMLAKIANLIEVRNALRVEFDILIPTHTIFIGAEHNTTTDEIVLFDSEVPKSHVDELNKLKLVLKDIQHSTISVRFGMIEHSSKKAFERSRNWAETRPEWGLARNAGFIIGPRKLTAHLDLNSRCFLHSYNWEYDNKGDALEAILQGPMVVTQWINSHYYFATVDNQQFGGGSKITHNVVGKFGVVQGNGGDLKFGLPLQSVKSADDALFHQPLRLTVIIHSPIAWVKDILDRNSNLKDLLLNQWIYLLVMDPSLGNEIFEYHSNGQFCVLNIADNKLAKAV